MKIFLCIVVVVASTFSCPVLSAPGAPARPIIDEQDDREDEAPVASNVETLLLEQVESLSKQMKELETRLKTNNKPIDEAAITSLDEVHTSEEIQSNVAKKNNGLSLREMLLLKAIMEEDSDASLPQSKYLPVDEHYEDENIDEEDLFDPVFGKLRDFLDSVSVDDLKRAITKVHNVRDSVSEKDKITSAKSLTVQKPPQGNSKTEKDGPCQKKFDEVLLQSETSVGVNLPYCDDEGFYRLKQCSGSVCYCVDKLGKATLGRAPVWEADELSCIHQQYPDTEDDAIQRLKYILAKDKDNSGPAEVSSKVRNFGNLRG